MGEKELSEVARFNICHKELLGLGGISMEIPAVVEILVCYCSGIKDMVHEFAYTLSQTLTRLMLSLFYFFKNEMPH